MASTWLAPQHTIGVGDRLQGLDAPIQRIGLHLRERLRSPGHNGMILLVTLLGNLRYKVFARLRKYRLFATSAAITTAAPASSIAA